MKRVLFWKIFLGFSVTFIFIVDGLWLLFNFVHPLPSETTRALSKISTGAAVAMIERGGEFEGIIDLAASSRRALACLSIGVSSCPSGQRSPG